MRSGFVYILRNPGLTAYKVGMTTRALYLRAGELRREYGTLYPFEIASRHAVNDPAAVEALAHRILGRHRVPRSELFACDLETCQRAVMKAAAIVLERRPLLRVWHWLTLPRPAPRRSFNGRRRYRRDDPAALLLLVLVGAVVAVLVVLKPDLPAWVPPSLLRATALLERRY